MIPTRFYKYIIDSALFQLRFVLSVFLGGWGGRGAIHLHPTTANRVLSIPTMRLTNQMEGFTMRTESSYEQRSWTAFSLLSNGHSFTERSNYEQRSWTVFIHARSWICYLSNGREQCSWTTFKDICKVMHIFSKPSFRRAKRGLDSYRVRVKRNQTLSRGEPIARVKICKVLNI